MNNIIPFIGKNGKPVRKLKPRKRYNKEQRVRDMLYDAIDKRPKNCFIMIEDPEQGLALNWTAQDPNQLANDLFWAFLLVSGHI